MKLYSQRSNRRKSIRICALVPYPLNTTPSQRFRIEQWAPILASEGISVDCIPFIDRHTMEYLHQPGQLIRKTNSMLSGILNRVLTLRHLKNYDIILIHRAASLVGPAVIERLLGLLKKKVIFDFDDAIFMLHVGAGNKYFGWLKFPGKTSAICRNSSQIIAGCEYLADYARAYNSNVTVVPTSIDTEIYKPLSNKEHKSKVVIGWTGSATSQSHLELFVEVLRKVNELREIEIRVQSNQPPNLPDVPFSWRSWSPENEISEIAEFDIGIKPMPDDPWARGKCPMKELQYMALGIPTVASNVGTSPEVIMHGENGFLANTFEEWVDCLVQLIDDQALRHRLGAAGRKTVENRYSSRHCALQFAEVVRTVLLKC